jgi:sirohydrochlorin ferrochelatase
MPEVGAQLSNQAVAVDQHRAPPATLAEHGEVLIIGCEVDVLDLEAERLADAEAQLGDQAEEQPIAAALGGDDGEDRVDLAQRHSSRRRRLEMDPLDFAHGVPRDQVVAVGPAQEAGNRRLLAGPGCGRQVGDGGEEGA